MSTAGELDLSGVTRFEVIDHTGGHGIAVADPHGGGVDRYTRLGVSVKLSVQDGGRTLKVFLDDSPVTPQMVRDQMTDGRRQQS